MSSADDLDWKIERLPAIKKELEDHGYTIISKSSADVAKGLTSCLFWLAAFPAATLIGIGVSSNKFTGAGVGIGLTMVAMVAVNVYYARKTRA